MLLSFKWISKIFIGPSVDDINSLQQCCPLSPLLTKDVALALVWGPNLSWGPNPRPSELVLASLQHLGKKWLQRHYWFHMWDSTNQLRGILGEAGTHSWEETIFISDNEKQKFYANSKDQLSTERPSSFREIRQAHCIVVRMALRLCVCNSRTSGQLSQYHQSHHLFGLQCTQRLAEILIV